MRLMKIYNDWIHYEYENHEFDQGIQYEIENALKVVVDYAINVASDKLNGGTGLNIESSLTTAAMDIRHSIYKLSKKMLEREILKAGLNVDVDPQTPQI